MRGLIQKALIPVLAILALLIVLGGLLWMEKPVAVKAAPQPAALPALLAQQPDNSQCLSCHGNSDQEMTFPNGDTVSISVTSDVYQHSVHSNLACQVCHNNITGFPHPENNAQSAREYTLQYKDTCNQCHPNQVTEIMDSAHQQLAKEGNPNTPICADCHNPHTQSPIEKEENGEISPTEHTKIANTCAKCHGAIVEQYRNSVHGEGVFETYNPDVPACNDCHGIHSITTTRTLEFRLNSPQMCAGCHTNKAMMDKYGLSTDVLDTYLADFHGTTVTLYENTNEAHELNKPVCYDCHGVHNIMRVDDPEKGIQMKENMLVGCQRCHPDATENFPDSWLSHYIPSPEHNPLVYYVQLFYTFFIPGVLGVMAVYVLSDVFRKFTRRGQGSHIQAPKEGGKE